MLDAADGMRLLPAPPNYASLFSHSGAAASEALQLVVGRNESDYNECSPSHGKTTPKWSAKPPRHVQPTDRHDKVMDSVINNIH